MSDFETVKSQTDIEHYAREHLGKSQRGGYICPCGSGTGKNKSGALYVQRDAQTFKCFSCGSGGDVFDLAGLIHETDSKRDQLQRVAEWAGISLSDKPANVNNLSHKKSPATPKAKPKQPEPDYTQGRQAEAKRIEEARKALQEAPEALAYLQARGISKEAAEAARLGYDPDYMHPAEKHGQRIIIPLRGSDYYHIDRDITGKAEKEKKYLKPLARNVGAQPVWNLQAIQTPETETKPLFIVEGALDAVALQAAGYEAVALLSTKHEPTAEALEKSGRKGVYIALDDDEKGNPAAAELKSRLQKAGMSPRLIRWGDIDGAKDAAEALEVSGIETVQAHISSVIAEYDKRDEEEQKEALDKALCAFNVYSAEEIARRVFLYESAADPIPTGFARFDEMLGGGLQRGLYVLGAISSLGKTTLAVQIADAIAASGQPVLFVTIEQSAEEITAKSLSRLLRAKGRTVSAQEIGNKAKRDRWDERTTLDLLETVEEYSQTIAPALKLLEGNGKPSVDTIRTVARMVEQQADRAPVIFIDYLQLLAPENDRDSDKQATDKNVMALRQLARDLNAPIFAISSLNRGSYSGTISLSSFKESGAIEYGADVLLGLQPRGIADKVDQVRSETEKGTVGNRHIEASKLKDVRKVELVILKNRHGRITGAKDGLPFEYNAVSNQFKEA